MLINQVATVNRSKVTRKEENIRACGRRVEKIVSIGLSFAVYKLDNPPEPQLVFDWSSNVTAATS